mmetsp:Transcript_11521/g.25589  ORF Transcript_11521/g.25589 Transcript_11521/m.25589 type:complete len:271 (+) Transcript_11521:1247-2059(+)
MPSILAVNCAPHFNLSLEIISLSMSSEAERWLSRRRLSWLRYISANRSWSVRYENSCTVFSRNSSTSTSDSFSLEPVFSSLSQKEEMRSAVLNLPTSLLTRSLKASLSAFWNRVFPWNCSLTIRMYLSCTPSRSLMNCGSSLVSFSFSLLSTLASRCSIFSFPISVMWDLKMSAMGTRPSVMRLKRRCMRARSPTISLTSKTRQPEPSFSNSSASLFSNSSVSSTLSSLGSDSLFRYAATRPFSSSRACSTLSMYAGVLSCAIHVSALLA